MKPNSIKLITSISNPKVKFACAVREGIKKDYIFIEGLRLSEEVLKTKLEITHIFFTEKFLTFKDSKNLLDKTESHKQVIISEKLMNFIADTETPQGIVMICKRPKIGRETIEQRITRKSAPMVVMLDRISNPSNLGAVLRTAEAADVDGVILTKGSVDVFSTKAIRGSMGSCMRLPIWEKADLSDILAWANEKNLVITCIDTKASKDYTKIDWKKPRLVIFGSEAQGISEELLKQAQETVKIPMKNNVESLNVAVACGIVLYEAIKHKTAS